jgi:formate C-acetyltransferase/4-hydroxyphenylacetate decarboxylase large subunit
MDNIGYQPREVLGKPSTDRVKKRYDELLNSDIYIDSERMSLYTGYMKEHWFEPPYARQGGAIRHILSNLTPVIKADELIVGSMSRFVRGTQLYPEYENRWMREAFGGVEREEERYIKGALTIKNEGERIGIYRIEAEDKEAIKKALVFWSKDWRDISEEVLKCREDFQLVEKWQQQLVFFRFMWDVPEGRVVPGYAKVIHNGLEFIIKICLQKMAELEPIATDDKLKKYDFYRGTILALQGVIAFAENYAVEAERLAKQEKDRSKYQELCEIARICRKVPRYPADSFREAVQSFWLAHCALFLESNGRGISPGRFDQYMYKPFENDVMSGRLTEDEGLELLELLRIKHSEIIRAHAKFTEAYQAGGGSNYQNLTLGGVDTEGRGADNKLSKLILQAGINIKSQQPTLSVRWSDNLSHDFKLKVVECIKAGSGYPALVSDRIGIERFVKYSGATLEDARDWVPCGCLDVNSPKRPPQWSVPFANAVKILELVLNDGINPVTGDKLIESGIKIDKASYKEIEESWIRLLGTIIDKMTTYWNLAMCIKNRIGLVVPFLSSILDDCIEKGLHCQEGGCRYNDSAYINICGIVNVANSLASIKKCVFEEKIFTMKELREALRNNFEGDGFNQIRDHLLKAPKFGNADNFVDQIAAVLYDAFADETEKNLNWLGEPWRASGISVTAQVVHGNACGATPDGRKAGEHLCDGSVSAYPGTDMNGPTALLTSACRIDHSKLQSHLFNLKFHPSAVEGQIGSEKFIALNDTYFDLGGYHIQYNIVDSRMLRDAQEHPDNYPDLMIRIAGFTARWVELGPAIQDEIISRTEHQTN